MLGLLLLVGVGMIGFGLFLLLWVVLSARRDRDPYVVVRPRTRYDEHLLRTEETEVFFFRM